ncbi:MAG: hypothetical protein A3F72_21770 [Bacteroidetes bacterium RIFCSPLOWO2_12_FULL_35_15]|nr:MAG: hypothetical protein A3F72_21770 [Bacteroidetes bacterium RIFCSPLOWO2_12_FULL_35_15]
MRYKKIKLSVLLLLGIELTGMQAQEAIPASGGNASGSGGSVSYSVGQVVYTTNTETNGSVAQGVQQPYEILIVTGLEEAEGINLVCSAYPNPATDFVKLKIENYKTENLTYQLYDISGKLLKNKKVESNEMIISLENLVHAAYFLKITDNNKEIKTFKIIKN